MGVTIIILLITSRMLKHLWGEPSQAHFEPFYEPLIIISHSIQFSKQTEVETE